MGKNAYVVGCLVIILAGLGGCSGEKSAKESTKAEAPKDKIRGTAQIVLTETNSTDVALSAGGKAAYIWEGSRRYRLFFNTPFEVEGGKEYVVEGVHAQKVIDELGDPDQGKNGYPLASSCRRAVKLAWPRLSLDTTNAHESTLRARIARFPARSVFLVTRIEPAADEKDDKAAAVKKAAALADIDEIDVPADKQKVLLVAGQTVRPAPLWEPAGATVNCKVLIDKDGNFSELRTGAQLCESVSWSEFRYKPTVQRGRPVNVATEVEVRFERRK